MTTIELNPDTKKLIEVEWSFKEIYQHHDAGWAEWQVSGKGSDGSEWIGSVETYAHDPAFDNEITDKDMLE